MAYSTSSPPVLLFQGVGNTGGSRIWQLSSSVDQTTVADADGYISNGVALGMMVNDTVIYSWTGASPLTSTMVVQTLNADGSVNLGLGTTVGSTTSGD